MTKKELEDMCEKLEVELKTANERISSLEKDLINANVYVDTLMIEHEKELIDVNKQSYVASTDEILFRGQIHKIIEVDIAKEIDLKIKRGYVLEDATCLVLDREGD